MAPGRKSATGFVAALWLSAALLSGCRGVNPATGSWRAGLRQDLILHGLDPAQVIVPFDLTPEGRAWLEENAPPAEGSPRERLDQLLTRMIDEERLGLSYERSFTGTADEVLRRRTGNCLGFVNLFVALARELGVPAYFLAVEDQPLYGREGDLVLVSDHVAAGYGSGRDLLILDFAVEGEPDYQKVRAVSDLEAVAKYYSNRGAEMLREGRAKEAVTWLETATRIEPSMASAWVNLGVARRRTADLSGAELAYTRALEADPRTLTAYQNLAALLRLKGREEEALRLLAVTDQAGNRNPYSFLSLGDWNRDSGRYDEARHFYRRALLLDARSAEAHAALGELELARGREAKARRWLKKALKMNPDDPRATSLAVKLSAG